MADIFPAAPDFRKLCDEQLPELRAMFERILCVARSSGGPAIGNIQLADRLIDAVVSWSDAALAQPEPEGPTDEELMQLPRDRDPDWRRSFTHENTNRPSGPPPLKFRRGDTPPPSKP